MKLKHSTNLTQMLRDTDTERRYRKYDAGYHDDNIEDVIVEYGFDDLKVYIPRMWNSENTAMLPAKREILDLAYRKSLGERAPVYGPRALAWIYFVKGVVPERYLKDLDCRRLTIPEMEAIGMSHWTISKKTGKYIIRRYDLDGAVEREAPGQWKQYYFYG